MVYRTCIAARIDHIGPELRHLEAVSDFGTDAKIGKRVLGICTAGDSQKSRQVIQDDGVALHRPFGHPEKQRTDRRKRGDERKARAIVTQPVGENAGDEWAADLADNRNHRRQAKDHAD